MLLVTTLHLWLEPHDNFDIEDPIKQRNQNLNEYGFLILYLFCLLLYKLSMFTTMFTWAGMELESLKVCDKGFWNCDQKDFGSRKRIFVQIKRRFIQTDEGYWGKRFKRLVIQSCMLLTACSYNKLCMVYVDLKSLS